MSGIVDFVVAPLRVAYLRRALEESALLAMLGATVGVHVILRRLAFLTEAVQHAVLPGIAIAFVTGTSLLAGAAASALAAIVVLLVLGSRRVDHDAAQAVIITVFVAVGVVIVSRRRGFQADLTALLFGRLLTVGGDELVQTAIVLAACAITLLVTHRQLVLVAFDRTTAMALGYRVAVLDAVLYALVAASVVASVRAVGTVLVVAFLVTPAATARVITDRIGPMILVAALIGALTSWLGLAVSYDASINHRTRLASGATVVLAMTVVFAVAVGVRIIVGRLRSVPPLDADGGSAVLAGSST